MVALNVMQFYPKHSDEIKICVYSPVVVRPTKSELDKLGTDGPFTSLLFEAPTLLPESTEFKLVFDANECDEENLGETPPRFGGGGGGGCELVGT